MLKRVIALSALLVTTAISHQVAASDRYKVLAPVIVSNDLTAPWVTQLGGRVAVSSRQRVLVPVQRRQVRNPVYQRAQTVAYRRPENPAKMQFPARLMPQEVNFESNEKPGTIIIDSNNRYLYFIQGHGKARRYGIGVGKPGFQWAGVHKVTRKAEWPGWTPPKEMIKREAAKGHYLPVHMDGGPANPLGARAMYIGSTEYRIHGTNAPWTIGYGVSSGCIRLRNQDVIDLYNRVKVGAKVIVK